MESLVNFRALAGLQLSTRWALEGKNSQIITMKPAQKAFLGALV